MTHRVGLIRRCVDCTALAQLSYCVAQFMEKDPKLAPCQ